MEPTTKLVRPMLVVGLTAMMLVLVLGVAPVSAATPAEDLQRTSILAYHSVVADKAFAPFTTADDLKRTSTVAYHSVVADKAFAPFTTAGDMKRTSTAAYYSVLH